MNKILALVAALAMTALPLAPGSAQATHAERPTTVASKELPPIKAPRKAVLTGKTQVGRTLSVTFRGSWGDGAKLRYEWWTASGVAFLGDKPTLKLIKGLKGRKVVCYVSGSKKGKESVTLLAGPSSKITG